MATDADVEKAIWQLVNDVRKYCNDMRDNFDRHFSDIRVNFDKFTNNVDKCTNNLEQQNRKMVSEIKSNIRQVVRKASAETNAELEQINNRLGQCSVKLEQCRLNLNDVQSVAEPDIRPTSAVAITGNDSNDCLPATTLTIVPEPNIISAVEFASVEVVSVSEIVPETIQTITETTSASVSITVPNYVKDVCNVTVPKRTFGKIFLRTYVDDITERVQLLEKPVNLIYSDLLLTVFGNVSRETVIKGRTMPKVDTMDEQFIVRDNSYNLGRHGFLKDALKFFICNFKT